MCVCVCVNTWILHTWMGWDTPTYVVKHEDVCDIFGSFGILENNGKHTSNILTWELRNAPWKWPQSKAMHSIVHRCVCVNLIKTGFLSFKISCIWVHILIWRYLKSAPVLWKRGSLPCTKSAPLHHSQPFPTFANDWIRSGNQVMPKDFGRTRCGRKLHPLPPGRSSSWVVVGPCWAGCALILHGGGTNLLILNDPQTFFSPAWRITIKSCDPWSLVLQILQVLWSWSVWISNLSHAFFSGDLPVIGWSGTEARAFRPPCTWADLRCTLWLGTDSTDHWGPGPAKPHGATTTGEVWVWKKTSGNFTKSLSSRVEGILELMTYLNSTVQYFWSNWSLESTAYPPIPTNTWFGLVPCWSNRLHPYTSIDFSIQNSNVIIYHHLCTVSQHICIYLGVPQNDILTWHIFTTVQV